MSYWRGNWWQTPVRRNEGVIIQDRRDPCQSGFCGVCTRCKTEGIRCSSGHCGFCDRCVKFKRR